MKKLEKPIDIGITNIISSTYLIGVPPIDGCLHRGLSVLPPSPLSPRNRQSGGRRYEVLHYFPTRVAAPFRVHIRRQIPTYERARHLPRLIHCPEEWLTSQGESVQKAIFRRLKLALYQQRQARTIRHYTFSKQKYEALLVAIGGELLLQRQRLKNDQHPVGTDSPQQIRSVQYPAIGHSSV